MAPADQITHMTPASTSLGTLSQTPPSSAPLTSGEPPQSSPSQIDPQRTRGGTTALVLTFQRPADSLVKSPTAVAETPAPIFTWEALKRQLSGLAVTPTQRALVPTLVSAIRKQSHGMSSEQVLREVLCIASVLMDETFHPELEEGEMT